MHPRAPFLLVLLALCFAAWLVTGGNKRPTTQTASTPAPVAVIDEQQRAREQEFEARQRQVHIEELAKLEAARKTSERTVESSQKALLGLQRQRNEQWSSFIHTNWPAYQILRQAATGSTNHTAHCTLCDGSGTMRFCILCQGDKMCPACLGSGRSADGGPCPVCFAKGTCSLCLGTGRMPCPFCDDGTVYASLAPPPVALPVFGTAASRPSVSRKAQVAIMAAPVVVETNGLEGTEKDSSETDSSAPPPTRRHGPASASASTASATGLAHQEVQIAAVFVLLAMIALLRLRAWLAARPHRVMECRRTAETARKRAALSP